MHTILTHNFDRIGTAGRKLFSPPPSYKGSYICNGHQKVMFYDIFNYQNPTQDIDPMAHFGFRPTCLLLARIRVNLVHKLSVSSF